MLQIYKASAGSGKTFTLAKEYIRDLLGIRPKGSKRYLLNHPKYVQPGSDTLNRHRFILAITFTNKATEEMKRRIIDELDNLTRPPRTLPDGKVKDANYACLAEEFGCTRQELAQVADNALHQLLHDYHNFNISTIDSFFQRVMRTFARELDRQGDYAVELDSSAAVRQAVDNMLEDFNAGQISGEKNDVLSSWIFSYISSLTDQGKKANFFNRSSSLFGKLVSQMSKITNEDFKQYYDDMRLYLADPGRIPAFEKALEGRCQQILTDLKARVDALLAPIEAEGFDISMLGKSILVRFVNTVRANVRVEISTQERNSLTTIADGTEKRAMCKEFKAHPAWRAAVGDVASAILRSHDDYKELHNIKKSLTQLGLLAFAWQYLDRYTVDNNTVLLSDTNHLLSRIIDGDETPFVYERMGVRLRNFLIDEFQDTSGLQWSNLRPLLSNSMGEGHDNLIIGDVKQSIYRFRSGDPEILHSRVEKRDFPVSDKKTEVKGEKPEENTNYRSSADIVRFNNTLFSILASELSSGYYDHVEQQVASKNRDYKGYVVFTPVAKDADGRQASLRHMATEMIRQHDQGGYRWGEIAVLVRKNEEGEEVIDYLMREHPGIPIMSEEALYLHKSTAVQRVVGMLKLIEQAGAGLTPPKPDKTYISITPAEVSVIESRFAYHQALGADNSKALDLATDIRDNDALNQGMERVLARKPASLVALVETVIHEALADATEGQIAYLAAFQDMVVEYCDHASPTLSSFLHHWDLIKEKATIPGSVDVRAVRVMTIHKSKGLEFKCVHIPFSSWKFPEDPSARWMAMPKIPGIDPSLVPPAIYMAPTAISADPDRMFHKEYSRELRALTDDCLNLTYVAYTRAEAELIVQYVPTDGWGNCLTSAFKKPPLCDSTDPEGRLVIGAPTTRRDDDKDEEASNIVRSDITINSYPVTYHTKMSTLTQLSDVLELEADVDDQAIEPSAATDHASQDKYPDEEARLRGVLLHDALSAITTRADITRAVRIAVRRNGADETQLAEAISTLQRMLGSDQPEVRRWFADGVDAVCEQTVYDARAGITRRPDRVVYLPDGSVEVVDYKFTSETDDHHTGQVAGYVRLLQSMGHDRVRGYLWYPFLDLIINV